MWLDKNEKKLLQYYYNKVKDKDGEPLDMDRKILEESVEIFASNNSCNNCREKERDIMESDFYKKVNNINDSLSQKKLIEIRPSPTDMVDLGSGSFKMIMDSMNLTIEGFDLAKKYCNWFSTLSIWGKEHASNPILQIIFYIITFMFGLFLGKIF